MKLQKCIFSIRPCTIISITFNGDLNFSCKGCGHFQISFQFKKAALIIELQIFLELNGSGRFRLGLVLNLVTIYSIDHTIRYYGVTSTFLKTICKNTQDHLTYIKQGTCLVLKKCNYHNILLLLNYIFYFTTITAVLLLPYN